MKFQKASGRRSGGQDEEVDKAADQAIIRPPVTKTLQSPIAGLLRRSAVCWLSGDTTHPQTNGGQRTEPQMTWISQVFSEYPVKMFPVSLCPGAVLPPCGAAREPTLFVVLLIFPTVPRQPLWRWDLRREIWQQTLLQI